MTPLQKMFLQAGAVKRGWREYLRENFGKAVAKDSNGLFREVLQDIVSEMSDTAIRRIAYQFIQADDLTDRERAQLAAILRWRNKRP